MRYLRYRKAAAGDVGVKYTGTMWLEPGAGGTLVRTEVCDPATKGASATGQYEQTGGVPDTLVLGFTTHQETWTKN